MRDGPAYKRGENFKGLSNDSTMLREIFQVATKLLHDVVDYLLHRSKGGQQSTVKCYLWSNLTRNMCIHNSGTRHRWTQTCLMLAHIHVLEVSQIDLLLLCWRG